MYICVIIFGEEDNVQCGGNCSFPLIKMELQWIAVRNSPKSSAIKMDRWTLPGLLSIC